MIIYEVIFCRDAYESLGALGVYSDKAIAEQVQAAAQANLPEDCSEKSVYIKEVEVFAELPPIYTHRAYLYFKDINDVFLEKLDCIQVVDNSHNFKLNKPKKHISMGLVAMGVNEKDTISKVKLKMVLAIQNGTYDMWKLSLELKEKSFANAIIQAKAQGIELKDNYPVEPEKTCTWYEIQDQCMLDLGMEL